MTPCDSERPGRRAALLRRLTPWLDLLARLLSAVAAALAILRALGLG